MDVDANSHDKEITNDDKNIVNVYESIIIGNNNKNLALPTSSDQGKKMNENISKKDDKVNKLNENKDCKRKLSIHDSKISESNSKKIKIDKKCTEEESRIKSLNSKEKFSDLNNINKTRIAQSNSATHITILDDNCNENNNNNENSLLNINNINNKNYVACYGKENATSCSDAKCFYDKVVEIIVKIDAENDNAKKKSDIVQNSTCVLENISDNLSKCIGNANDITENEVCVTSSVPNDSTIQKETTDEDHIELLESNIELVNPDSEIAMIEDHNKIDKFEFEYSNDENMMVKTMNDNFNNDTNIVSQSIIENIDNHKIKSDYKEIITISDDESFTQSPTDEYTETISNKLINNEKERKVNVKNLFNEEKEINETNNLNKKRNDTKMPQNHQNISSFNLNENDKQSHHTTINTETIIKRQEPEIKEIPMKVDNVLLKTKDGNKTLDHTQSLDNKGEIPTKIDQIVLHKESKSVDSTLNVDTKKTVKIDYNDIVVITDDEDEDEADDDANQNENLSSSTKSFSSESDDAMKKFCADNTADNSMDTSSIDNNKDKSSRKSLLKQNNDENKIINKKVGLLISKGTSTPNSNNNSTSHVETNVFNITPIKKCDGKSGKTLEIKDLEKNIDNADHVILLDCNDDIEMQELNDTSAESANCTTSGSDTEQPILSDGITRFTKFAKKYIEDKFNSQHQTSSNHLQIDTKSNDCLLGTETSEDSLYEVNIIYEENEMHLLTVEKINMKKLSSSSKRSSSNGSVSSLGQFQLPIKTAISASSSSSGSGIQQQQSRLSTNLSPSTSLSSSSIKSNQRTSENQKTYDGKFVIPQLPKKIRQTIRGTLALCNFMIEHFNKLKQINKTNIMNAQEIINNGDDNQLNESNDDSDCTMSPIINKNKIANIDTSCIASPTLIPSAISAYDDIENNSLFLNSNINTKQIGNIVLARWTDRKHYSGTIQNVISNNKYVILFDDNAVKTLSKKNLIFSYNNVLPLIDQNVHIINKPNTSELGLVISYNLNKDDNKVYYTVITEGSTCIVTSSDIFLSEDQAKIVNQNLNSTVLKICNDLISVSSLDNSMNLIVPSIVDIKSDTAADTLTKEATTTTTTASGAVSNVRVTRSRRSGNDESSLKIKSPQAGFSGGIVGRRKRPTKRQQMAATTFSESSDISDSIEFDSAPNSPDSALEAVEGVQPELQKTPRESEISKRNLITDFMGNDESRLEELLGPIVTKKTLFRNKHFLLTCTIPIKKRSNNPDEMNFSSIPYYKDYLIKQIEAGGGKVYNHFEDVPNGIYKKCKLIAPYPCVTAKYIQCLACDISAVSHEWIIKCCQKSNVIDLKQYLLPSGWSVVNETYIRWIPGKINDQRHSKSPFMGIKILIASHNKDFVEFWNRVCKLNGATINIIKNMNDITKNTKGYMLTDQEFSQDVKIKAEHFGIAIVSTVWIVENLIVGKIIPPNTNKKLTQIYQDDDY